MLQRRYSIQFYYIKSVKDPDELKELDTGVPQGNMESLKENKGIFH